MIDRMEDAGMVERRPDPNDRRAWRLYLTDKSRPLIGQLRELGDQLMEQALQGVAADDRQRLGDILNTIRTNLSAGADRSEEHTSELQSLMRISYAVFCLKKNNKTIMNN